MQVITIFSWKYLLNIKHNDCCKVLWKFARFPIFQISFLIILYHPFLFIYIISFKSIWGQLLFYTNCFNFFCWTYQSKYVNYLFNLFRSLLYFQILCYTLCAPCYNVHLMRSRSFITLLCINNAHHKDVRTVCRKTDYY